MDIVISWLPDLGQWTGAVSSSVFACQVLVGFLAIVAVGIRAYRLFLQMLLFLLKK